MYGNKRFQHWLMFGCALGYGIGSGVSAAPGNIEQTPMYLSPGAQPNIFLMIDDSGSMDWEVLLSREAQAAHSSAPNSGNVDFTPDNSTERRELCSAYNVLAYDPTKSYTPWLGFDELGIAYQDQTIAAARTNPYDADIATSLTNHFYFPWSDSNNNGLYDSGECPTPSVTTASSCVAPSCIRVSSLSSEEQINYANWYSYYRKREYVAKRALSQIVYQSTSRMGLSTLWNNNLVGTPISDMTALSGAGIPENRNELLDSLSRINSSGGTPLRIGLRRVGNYFSQVSGDDDLGDLFGGATPPSPILSAGDGGSCQKNFTLLMSDGYWNGSTSPAVGNADGDGNTVYDGASFADSYSNTLADVAMYFYERDLAPDIPNEVSVIAGIDENPSQHLVTYTVSFGIDGTLSSNPPNYIDPFPWPQPIADSITTTDDMRHAAWNGRGQFLSAGDPASLIESLNAVIRDIQDRSGTAAAVSFNSTSLQTDTLVYQSMFDAEGWHGNLVALDITTGGVGAVAWRAGDILDARDLSGDPRSIVTFNGSNGVSFAWNNLTLAQKADLCALGRDWSAAGEARLPGWSPGCYLNASGTAIEGDTQVAEKLVDYFKGRSTDEGNGPDQFRERGGRRLGDIVHSGPLYVGPPSARYPDAIEGVDNRYSGFVAANADRAGMVYVGTNGGMLHGFDSSENLATPNSPGREVFGYIPNLLFSAKEDEGLHYLAEHDSPNSYNHRFYVDLSASAADVFVDGAWRTYLIGGLRAGGKGIFALDITDPSASPSTIPKWEFTHDDMGYGFSEIRIGRMKNGKWAAIFGNGYNNDPSGDGSAKLFVVYLDGSNLSSPIVLDTKTGPSFTGELDCGTSDCNGLSSPEIADLNGDGIIDRVYAGDIHGNLWAFDVRDANPSNWKPAYGTLIAPQPLFKACAGTTCTTANRQPITARPSLALHATKSGVATWPNVMVFFGTGQYLASGDNATTGQQSFYGVWDSGVGGKTRIELQEQTIDVSTFAIGTDLITVRNVSSNSVDYPPAMPPSSPEYGWYIDLPITRERVVVASQTIGDLVFFNTMIPSVDMCTAGGSGWLMVVSQIDGSEPEFPVVDLNEDGLFDLNDIDPSGEIPAGVQVTGIPTESRFISDKRVTATSTGDIKFENVQLLPPSPPGRMSWSELAR